MPKNKTIRKPKAAGILEVGTNDEGEVVLNHPDLKPDKDGVGHIVFSPKQSSRSGSNSSEASLHCRKSCSCSFSNKSQQEKVKKKKPFRWIIRKIRGRGGIAYT